MPSEFDIYGSEKGYTAVTSQVRRAILARLEEGDAELADLVEATGKSKPTLSSVHVKELLAAGLVAERPHPEDHRRKIYRLAARKIGSSNLPEDQLRAAVRHYVTLSPLAARLPVGVVLEAIASAPEGTADAVLRAQAFHLGTRIASWFASGGASDLVTGVARLLEREEVARPTRIDLEASRVEFEVGPGIPPDLSAARLRVLVAGLVEGAGRERGLRVGSVIVRGVQDAPGRFEMSLPRAVATS